MSVAPRVLLGNLEPIVRVGMTTVLGEEGIEVVGADERPHALVLSAGRLRPAGVGPVGGRAPRRPGAPRVRTACPGTTVVLWARDEEVMEVVGPGSGEARRVAAPSPGDLCGALAAGRALSLRRGSA